MSTADVVTPRGTVPSDALASVVVFLVALPLCMGIALASGVPVERGIVTGIVGGLIVGFLSGQPLQVSGPAAGLSVMVWEIVRDHGLSTLGIIVFIAGVVQLAAGLAKLGQWFRAVSPAVIQGMLAGIGVLILSQQWHVLFDGKPLGSGLRNIAGMPGALWDGLANPQHRGATIVAAVAFVALIGWLRFQPKQLKMVPSALVAVVASSLVAWAFKLDVAHVSVPQHLASMVAFPSMHDLRSIDVEVIRSGFAFALIASAETLLSATAVDQMHDGPRTRYDRELTGQGIGNIICGLIGALPMTGVIVRSATNVNAGAKTRLSVVLHGAWLLLAVVAFGPLLQHIPTAALAAILVHTGYKLVNPAAVRRLWLYSRMKVLIYTATVVTIVLSNLLEGVLIGIGFALADLVRERVQMEVRLIQGESGLTLKLNGAATFILLPKLATMLQQIPPGATVVLDYGELQYIDLAVIDLLRSFQEQHTKRGGHLDIPWVELERRGRQTRRVAIETKGESGAILGQMSASSH